MKSFTVDNKTIDFPDLDILCLVKHGSHLYGMSTPESDLDIKGVYIPSEKDLFLGNSKSEYTWSSGSDHGKNSKEDVDVQFFSLPRFIEMLINGDTIAVDMIHCNKENLLFSSDEWDDLQSCRSIFYQKNMKAFTGYIKKQVHRYGVRGSRVKAIEDVLSIVSKHSDNRLGDASGFEEWCLKSKSGEHSESFDITEKNGEPFYVVCVSKYSNMTRCNEISNSLQKKLDGYGDRAKKARENNGVDWKAVSHAFRCAYQLKEIFETGDLKHPLKDAEYLLKIKKGELEFFNNLDIKLDNLVKEVEAISMKSDFRDKVEEDKVWDFCLILMKNYFRV